MSYSLASMLLLKQKEKFMNLSIRSISAQLALSAILFTAMLPNLARGDGGTAGGGGNAVGGTLLDFYENEGSTKVNVTDLAAYRNQLKPILQNLSSKLPTLKPFLEEATSKKIWLMETKPFNYNACVNTSMFVVNQVIVACQDEFEVRISKSWFESADSKNQAGLIMHELLIYHVLKTAKSAEDKMRLERNARALNRIFFSEESISSLALQQTIASRGFGDFVTPSEHQLLIQKESEFKQLLCSPESIYATHRLVMDFYENAMNNTLSPALQNAYNVLGIRSLYSMQYERDLICSKK